MKFIFITIMCVTILCSCSEQKQKSPPFSEEKTKAVLDHHWVAFQQNDLEETMKDYTEESVLITPDVTYKGLAEIKENFVKSFCCFP